MVYYFSDEQIRRQLKVLLTFALLQLPIAIHQKLTAVNPSGDLVTGTTEGSGILSILLICAKAMMTAFLVKRKIRLMFFMLGVILLFIPMTINETTRTLFLLPLAFVLPALFAPSARGKLRQLISIAALGAVVMVVFASIYNMQWGDRWGW
jgi:hypothetical protein